MAEVIEDEPKEQGLIEVQNSETAISSQKP